MEKVGTLTIVKISSTASKKQEQSLSFRYCRQKQMFYRIYFYLLERLHRFLPNAAQNRRKCFWNWKTALQQTETCGIKKFKHKANREFLLLLSPIATDHICFAASYWDFDTFTH